MNAVTETDPLHDPQEDGLAQPEPTRERVTMPRVLVVEDDPPARRSISRSLRGLGYRVMGAPDGVEALRLYEKHGADVVVTDIFMPNMDGVDLILNLVLEHPVPVIAITGAPNQNPTVRSALLFGAREVLSKPFDTGRLAAAVSRALAG